MRKLKWGAGACCPHIPCPLDGYQINTLGNYNGERARGLMHTPEYAAKMKPIQDIYNAWVSAECEEHNRAEFRRAGMPWPVK
jgi:hypothetical protein